MEETTTPKKIINNETLWGKHTNGDKKIPTLSELNQFHCTEGYHYNPLFPGMNYSDGVKFLSDNGCAWLVTDILSNLAYEKKLRGRPFISIKTVSNHEGDSVVYGDGDGNEIHIQRYEFGFNAPIGLKLFFTDALILSSEY